MKEIKATAILAAFFFGAAFIFLRMEDSGLLPKKIADLSRFIQANAVIDSTPPGTPQNLRSIWVHAFSVRITFDRVTDNSGLPVRYSATRCEGQSCNGGSVSVSDTGQGGIFITDSNARPNRTYRYFAIAIDQAGNVGAWSEPLTVTTPSGPILWWKFNDLTATTTVSDSSGNGRTGVLFNGAERIGNNRFGGLGVYLDGTNDYIKSSSRLTASTTYTVLFSFFASTTKTARQTLLYRGNSSECAYEPMVQILPNPDNTPVGFISGCSGSGKINTPGATNYPLIPGGWHDFAVVVTPVSQKLFVNGGAVFTSAKSPRKGSFFLNLGSSPGNNFFTGIIDNVQFYDRALSAEEVFGSRLLDRP